MPGLPMEDEKRLADPATRAKFLQRVQMYQKPVQVRRVADLSQQEFAALMCVPVNTFRVGQRTATRSLQHRAASQNRGDGTREE